MIKFLNLGGYIGPRAADADASLTVEIDNELADAVSAAIAEGNAVTVDLAVETMTEKVMAVIAEAMAQNPYLAAKNEAAAKAVSQSAGDSLAAMVKAKRGGVGTGILDVIGDAIGKGKAK